MDPLFPQPSLDGLAVLVKVTRAPPLSSSFHIHRMARSPLLTLIPRLPACLTALGCCLLGSCHPYQENPPYRPTPRTLPRPAPAVVAAHAPGHSAGASGSSHDRPPATVARQPTHRCAAAQAPVKSRRRETPVCSSQRGVASGQPGTRQTGLRPEPVQPQTHSGARHPQRCRRSRPCHPRL